MDKKAALEQLLQKFWDENVLDSSELPLGVENLYTPLDSVTAIDVLSKIKELFKDVFGDKKIPAEDVIQNGGYRSKDEFVQKVVKAVAKHFGA
ncbi:hypothetical protein [Pseudomonas weihenstephanensis]|uniref:hypothetical protein n=1 Tax=Pseudomonas weihenstephanensis TaxID=1608994 RepID=UPI00193BBA8A|nr:hypothetical protein [Pseudomonas weihenstephanensis]MBM1191296.1 hypothetical protein [Pseudomonas weihenstephanensis]